MTIQFKRDLSELANRSDEVKAALAANPKPEGTLGKIAARKFLEARGLSRDAAEAALKTIPAIEREVDGVTMKSWTVESLEAA